MDLCCYPWVEPDDGDDDERCAKSCRLVVEAGEVVVGCDGVGVMVELVVVDDSHAVRCPFERHRGHPAFR